MPLKVSDGISAWIKDFKKSDAPQFKGKSEEERREMAVAAYLDAKRGPQKESFELEENKARQSADLAKAMAAFKKRGGKIKKLAPGKAAGYHGKDDPGKGVHGMMDRPDTKGMPRKKVRSLRAGVEESMNVYRVGHSKISGNVHAKDEKDALNQLRKKGLKGPIRLTYRGKASQQIQRNSVNEEMMFKVSVEGLPPMIMLGRSPGDIKGQLRKIVKQPSMITDVERMTKADVKKRYRDMAKGDGDEEA